LEAARAIAGGDPERKKQWSEKHNVAYRSYSATVTIYWQLQEIARLVLSNDIVTKIRYVKEGFNSLTAEIIAEGGVSPKFNALFDELQNKQEDLAKALRAELGI
jgi:hypothetical protein